MCTFPKQSHLRTTSRELLRWRLQIYERHSQACTAAEGELLVKKCLYVLGLLAIWSLPQQSQCVKWGQPPCSTTQFPDETKPLHLRTIWRASRPPTAESTESLRGLVLDTRPLSCMEFSGSSQTSCVQRRLGSSWLEDHLNNEDFTELRHWGFL